MSPISVGRGQPAASVVIATRNRRDELRQTLEAVYEQTVPLEVIVLDDASTDGTGDMVRRSFSQVIYERHEQPSGYIGLRNRGNSIASAPIVVSLDDDSVLTSKFTVEQTLEDFDHERIGAVAIPYFDGQGKIPTQHPPDEDRTWITSIFIGTAHALRRGIFLGVGGYYPDWFRQAEELDFCVRMLRAGYVVRLGTGDPLEHRPSPTRSFEHMDRYGRRNLMLFTWYNVPARYLPLHFARVMAKGALLAVSTGRPLNHWRGFVEGARMLPRQRDRRRPVSPEVYRLHRLLQRRKAVPLAEIESRLPPLDRSLAAPADLEATPIGVRR
jgi:glycosyltransferase involved in cell wall biosynthesis